MTLYLGTNLDKALSNNLLIRNKLVRPIYKVTKSITKTISKVLEFKTYNKIINNFIDKNKRCETGDKKL